MAVPATGAAIFRWNRPRPFAALTRLCTQLYTLQSVCHFSRTLSILVSAMKTGRRHELETNELAQHISRGIDAIKPYSKAVTGVILAVLVVVAAYLMLGRQSTASQEAGWNDYWLASLGGRVSPEDLESVADAHRGTSVEDWARLSAADVELEIGTRLLFRDKQAGRRRLLNAEDMYAALREKSGLDAVRQRATYGMARVYEALGRLDDAQQTYAEVEGAFRSLASARAEFLRERQVRSFYDWFAEAEPPAPDLSSQPGTPGVRPDVSIEGLDDLDLSAPSKTSPQPDAVLDDVPSDEPAEPNAPIEPIEP